MAAYHFHGQLCLWLQDQHTLVHCPHSTEGVGSSFNDQTDIGSWVHLLFREFQVDLKFITQMLAWVTHAAGAALTACVSEE